jgi:ribonuclease E
MKRNRKELLWTTMALAGVGLGALAASNAHGQEDRPLQGPEVRQRDGERRAPRGEGQMQREGQQQREGQRGEARAQGERPQRGEARPGDNMRRLLEGLELTEEQREKVRGIVQEGGEKARAFMEENREKFESLRNEMRTAREAGDREKMRELAQKMRELTESGPRGQTIEEIKKVLTPEQLKKFEENLAAERERMQPPPPRGERGEGAQREPRERGEGMQREQRERRQPREGQNREDAPRGDRLEI